MDVNLMKIENIHIITALTIFLVWANFLQWMRFYASTAHFITMIVETLYDITNFLYIQLIFGGGFLFTLMFLNFGNIFDAELAGEDPEDASLVPKHLGSRLIDGFLNQYLLILGEFQIDNIDVGVNGMTWVLFILATFLS